jgi:glucokinase
MPVDSPGRLIGLDVGGSFLKGARVDRTGRVEARLHQPVAGRSAEDLLDQLVAAVVALEEGAAPARAVGIGLPGIVERGALRVRVAPAVPVLNGLPVGEEVSRRTGRPTFLENDANAAALAEAWLGAGRGARSLLLVTLGTGIGGGLVLEGRIWTGQSGYAGEVGHIQVEPDGVPCACGSHGCLETVAGAPGWKRRAEAALASRQSSLSGRPLDPETIVEAARSGDPVALEVVEGSAAALGVGVAATLDLLNLDRVIVAGGVAAAGAFLLDRIVAQVQRRTFPQIFADCSFRVAELGPDAGVVGAARVALLALDETP